MKIEEKIESVQEQLQDAEKEVSKFQKILNNLDAYSRHPEFYEEQLQDAIEERDDLYDQLDRLERKKEMKLYG